MSSDAGHRNPEIVGLSRYVGSARSSPFSMSPHRSARKSFHLCERRPRSDSFSYTTVHVHSAGTAGGTGRSHGRGDHDQDQRTVDIQATELDPVCRTSGGLRAVLPDDPPACRQGRRRLPDSAFLSLVLQRHDSYEGLAGDGIHRARPLSGPEWGAALRVGPLCAVRSFLGQDASPLRVSGNPAHIAGCLPLHLSVGV